MENPTRNAIHRLVIALLPAASCITAWYSYFNSDELSFPPGNTGECYCCPAGSDCPPGQGYYWCYPCDTLLHNH